MRLLKLVSSWHSLAVIVAVICAAYASRSDAIPVGGNLSADTSTVAPPVQMIDVRGGSFMMGQDPEPDFEQSAPRHRVTIRAFRLAATTVTFEQYDAFAAATGRVLPQDEGQGRGAHPVININRQDMLDFIRWLNGATGRHFRLPSEAEWEYAARAGTTSRYFWGDKPDPERANSSANTGTDQYVYTAPVASFPPNAWGFYDMAGNVWQAVNDCLHSNYAGAPIDGRPWVEPGCKIRIARGGYFGSRLAMGSATRAAIGEDFRSMGLGFRLAEDLSDER